MQFLADMFAYLPALCSPPARHALTWGHEGQHKNQANGDATRCLLVQNPYRQLRRGQRVGPEQTATLAAAAGKQFYGCVRLLSMKQQNPRAMFCLATYLARRHVLLRVVWSAVLRSTSLLVALHAKQLPRQCSSSPAICSLRCFMRYYVVPEDSAAVFQD